MSNQTKQLYDVFDVIIQYVNERDGARPPTICDEHRNYYTITDACIEQGIVQVGHSYKITYWLKGDNPNYEPFKMVSKINDAPIPRDKWNGGKPQQSQKPQPQPVAHQPQQQAVQPQQQYQPQPQQQQPRPQPQPQPQTVQPAGNNGGSNDGLADAILMMAASQIMGMFAYIEDYNDRQAAIQSAWEECKNLINSSNPPMNLQQNYFPPIDSGQVKTDNPL